MSDTRPPGDGDNRQHSTRGSPTLPLRGAERRKGGFSRAHPEPGAEPLAERGQGRRRMAVVVPAVAVVCGFVAGGLVGERVVGRRPAVAAARAGGGGSAPAGASGPVEQLRGAGTLLFTDPQGRAHAQAADGRDHRVLGQLGELADEPTAEPDEDNRDRAVGLLRDAADRGAAVVVATHDPEVVKLCDRVVRLVDGRPVELDPDSVGGGSVA